MYKYIPLQVFSENVRTKARDLKREKRRAEGLVYQMLPRSGLTTVLIFLKLFSELLLTT